MSFNFFSVKIVTNIVAKIMLDSMSPLLPIVFLFRSSHIVIILSTV